ncbi:MAG TPA: hypothetical protein VG674_09815 [Amycolatopsis sp.]|nr:hypothetical protein [Amycolatopsis sp.]
MDWWWLEHFGKDPDEVARLPLNTRDRVPFIAELAAEQAKADAKRG